MSSLDRLKPIKPGQPLSAAQANLINRLLQRKITGPNVIEHAGGWHIRSDRKASGVGSALAVFKYKAYADDIDAISCEPVAGIEGSEPEDRIDIARDWLNRYTPFNDSVYNGVRYNYGGRYRRLCELAGNSNVSWVEVLTPPYKLNGYIYALKCSSDVTMLEDIEWLEIGARTWAKEYEA